MLLLTLSFTFPLDHFFFFWAFPTPVFALTLGGWRTRQEERGRESGPVARGQDERAVLVRLAGVVVQGKDGAQGCPVVIWLKRRVQDVGTRGFGKGRKGRAEVCEVVPGSFLVRSE